MTFMNIKRSIGPPKYSSELPASEPSSWFLGFNDLCPSATLITPQKHRSPASKESQFKRLLQFQEKLVAEKGFPKSRIQTELEMTPPSPVKQGYGKPKCSKNLLQNFHELNGDYQKVFSSGKNSSSLTHSRYEPHQKDNFSSNISSVSSIQSPDNPAVQKPDFKEGIEASPLQKPDFKEGIEASPSLYGAPFPFTARTSGPITTPNVISAISLKPAGGEKCVDFVDRGVGHVKSEMGLPQSESVHTMARGKENSSTRPGDVLPNLQQTLSPHPQGQFPPQGWIYNWGSIYCWSCQSYGFLLQPMQV